MLPSPPLREKKRVYHNIFFKIWVGGITIPINYLYDLGNNGGYFESGDNSNNYNNRQKDNYRGGNRRQPPGGVTNFRGGAGSEPPIHHQAFTTPPPNFTRASSSGGGFGSNNITNGGFSAGPGQNSNHQNHQLNLKEGDKVMAKYWEVNNFIFSLTFVN